MARRRSTATADGATGDRADKHCASCGRRIEWRRKWERDWDQVRHCSTACRRRGVTAEDERLEALLLEALGRTGSAAPEEAQRAEVVQGGRVVDASTARGPFRLRRARP